MRAATMTAPPSLNGASMLREIEELYERGPAAGVAIELRAIGSQG
jgi:hypothetical protein